MLRLYYSCLLCLCLAACGQKGPLYIPQEEPTAAVPATVSAAPAAANPAAATGDNADDDEEKDEEDTAATDE